ncbi:YbjQ family protein [Boseongicola aestuarii]|nr:YbjQ family protein [Boseongicola aestuarii]
MDSDDETAKVGNMLVCGDCRTTTGIPEPRNEKLEWGNEDTRRSRAVDAIIVTTETMLDGIHVKKRLGVVTAECAYGMNIFKDLFAGIRNIVGGRSEAVQKTMRDARETVLKELKREAHSVGANAVIAVDLDYTQIGDKGWNMVLLIASGTAVIIEEIPKTALDETEG